MINKTKTIPKGWKKYILKDSVQFLRGSGLSKDKIVEGGKNKCVLYGELYTKYNEIIKEVQSRTNSIEGTKSRKGDVLLPSSTTTKGIDLANAVAINEDNILLGGDIIIIRDENNIFNNNYFAHYLTHERKKDIERLTQGTTIIHLYSSGLKNLEITLPSIQEQNKIAEILSKVDEDIEKTDQIIKETEKLKKGLMQELLTKGIGHKKFKKTELGEIPDEWEVVKLKEYINLSSGKFNPTKNLSKNRIENFKYPVYGGNGITGFFNTFLLNFQTLVIGRVGEYCGSVYITAKKSWITDNAIYIKDYNKNVIDFKFLYYLFKKINLRNLGEQTGQPKITQEPILNLLIALPFIKEQKQIAEILSEVDNKIDINKQIKNKLTQLKKGLMQDLLSGRVRVKNL